MIIGYTTGVYDMFHVGHLNLLMNAKSMCDYLIVGVSTDDLVRNTKNKTPIISYKDRIRIVESIKYVDEVVPQNSMNKLEAYLSMPKKFDLMFVGSDWQGTERWLEYEKQFAVYGVKIVYIPYTEGVSSTILREKLTSQKK